ncbi:MAG: methyltransferase domain-containing protein [Rubrivivax sp.]|nr:methyltransferase domain-containing protein [Rubrivivax sp.]
MDTLQSYDELPYDRLPFPETEPDFLAALARLHGFAAADARRARVLELGCAQGGNLIPMAARYPAGEFVGIDLSRLQIEEGQAFIARTELANIRLLHGDIAALPDDLGEFDFIIAHGVYSWVPDFVREALLSACRRLLKPHGVAYISFNVAAGWHTYGRIRQLLLQHDNPELGPMQRVENARSLLAATSFEDERLQKEADYLKNASASYVFHEYLSDINTAYAFEQFAADAAGHGLRYLGEAGPRRARVALENDWGLSPQARYERWLDAEAALDAALGTRFRRALLVRDAAALPQPQQAGILKELAFSAELSSDDELDLAEAGEQHFMTSAGERLPVSHPLLKAFLVVLASAYPKVVGFDDAVGHAVELAREYGCRGEADDEFLEALLDFAQMQGLRLHAFIPPHAAATADFPQASGLARSQAAAPGWPVTNAFHLALDIDEWGRRLLAAMDGSMSIEALGKRLLSELGEAGIRATPEQAALHAQNYVAFFRRQALGPSC